MSSSSSSSDRIKTIMIVDGDNGASTLDGQTKSVKSCLENIIQFTDYNLFPKDSRRFNTPFELHNISGSTSFKSEVKYHDSETYNLNCTDNGVNTKHTYLETFMDEKFCLTNNKDMFGSSMTTVGPTPWYVLEKTHIVHRHVILDPWTRDMWTWVDSVIVSGDFHMKNTRIVVVPSISHPSGSHSSLTYYQSMIDKYKPDRILFCVTSNKYKTSKTTTPFLCKINRENKKIIDYVSVVEEEDSSNRQSIFSSSSSSSSNTITNIIASGNVISGDNSINYFMDNDTHDYPSLIQGTRSFRGGSMINNVVIGNDPTGGIQNGVMKSGVMKNVMIFGKNGISGYSTYTNTNTNNKRPASNTTDGGIAYWVVKENMLDESTRFFEIENGKQSGLRDYILHLI